MPSATHEDLILIDELNVALGSGTDEAAIEDWRREGGKLDTHLARLALHQIQQSIERRTAGPDGWPLWER